jgi:TonB family protein
MKLIHAILGLSVASLLPTAVAQEPASKEARPYRITIASDVKPVVSENVRYPYMAGSRNLEGACDVSFAISRAGRADAIRVEACTSDMFREAAKKNVERMAFAPRASATDNVRMNIAWEFDTDVRTASLE